MTVLHGNDTYQDHYVFLFNDLFLITKQRAGGLLKKEGYDLRGKVVIDECRIINIADTESKKLMSLIV